MKTISIVTPCRNEESNVDEIYQCVRAEMEKAGKYKYEHIFIDNGSKDNTVALLKRIASRDHNVKIIVNARDFGQIRSPLHALFQTRGDAVIGIVADLQDPPSLIPEMIARWEEGYSMVLCIKETSDENPIAFWMRRKFYQLIQRLSSIPTFENFTGFGLYDRRVIEAMRSFDDPYPYVRGMIAEIGLPYFKLPYNQPARKRGFSKSDLYTLYDIAMLGITNMSKVPLRLVTFLGFACSLLSLLTGLGYLVYKLLFWANFNLGIAPLVIGLFFLGSVQLLSMGILGEYIGSVHTQVQKRPYVIEKERINFEYEPGEPAPEGRNAINAISTLESELRRH